MQQPQNNADHETGGGNNKPIAVTDRNAGGAIQEKAVKYYWRIVLASAVGILPIGSIQANVGSKQSGELQVAWQGAQQVAQAGVSATNKGSTKSAGDNFKWAIKPLDVDKGLVKSVDDNYKWAIKPGDQPATRAAAAKKPASYFQRASSYATHPESDPPRYVRNLSKIGVEAFKDVTWLDIGFEHRTRYEMRSDDIRRTEGGFDNPFLLRSRAYIAIKDILDPFRFAVEFQDSRRYNGRFAHDDRDFNSYDLINGYGELYFKRALGEDDRKQNRPLRLRVGRMAYEALDRRFIGRNEWRNTTNTFEGFRLNLGQEVNDWEVDMWAYQPVKRIINGFDQRIDNQWFYGAIGHWRKWSDIILLQPHYMGLTQNGTPGATASNQIDREIHSPALRGYGKIGNTGLDYDFNLIYQFGHQAGQRHEAYGYVTEVGQTFKHAWKPRLSLFYGYASGDRDPNDNVNNRFERFFGFARPWSADDYIVFENIKAPKIKLEFQPAKDLQIDGGYNFFWLASSTDQFKNLLDGNNSAIANPGFNRDKTGRSGDHIGHAVDIRARYKLTSRVDTTVGYSHFTSGNFTINRQIAANGSSPGSSDFFYVEVLISAFK